jgi:cob(I)alamin adenosyltransferase
MPDSQFYTGRGDDGQTRLLGPQRVSKAHPQPQAYGTVDEAQAALGLARAMQCLPQTMDIVLTIQRDLYALMSELASTGNPAFSDQITADHIHQLEGWIAKLERQLDVPREFVIPGDSPSGAALHLARTIVRRAERQAVRLKEEGLLTNDQILGYLNRLSSLLFVLALAEDQTVTRQTPTLAKK